MDTRNHGRQATITGAGQIAELAAVRCAEPRVWTCAVDSAGALAAAQWGGAVREASLIARAIFGTGGASHQLVEWDAVAGSQISVPAASLQLGVRSRADVAWPAGLVLAVAGTIGAGTGGRTSRPTLTSEQRSVTVAAGPSVFPVPAYARAALVHEELGDYTAAQWFGDFSRDSQTGAGSSISRVDAADWRTARASGYGIPIPGQARFLSIDVIAGNTRVLAVQWLLDL